MRKRIARVTSNILHPVVTGIALIIIVSFASAASVFDAVKWALIVIALSILPLFLALIYLVRSKKVDSYSANIRTQRTRLYILAAALSGVGSIIFHFLAAPLELTALFIAGFMSIVIFLLINLRWKLSNHTASIAALAMVAIILYGFWMVPIVVLIPLVVWARAELGSHSLAQGIAGAILTTSIIVLVFYLFGII